MNRRSFAALTVSILTEPLVAGPARADAVDERDGPATEPAPRAHSESLSTDEIVARVAAFYDEITTFRAHFRQYLRAVPYDKKRNLDGVVVFEKPGKMSWRYTSSGNRMVSDGSRIQVYERENKQLFELEPEKSQYLAALSFLGTQGMLTSNFKFTKVDEKLVKLERVHRLLAEPRQRSLAYEKLVFYVDARTFEVSRVLLMDAAGNRNRFDLGQSKANPRVPPDEFTFSPPPGTRIIRL